MKGAAARRGKIFPRADFPIAERLALATVTAGFAFFRADLAAATGFSQLSLLSCEPGTVARAANLSSNRQLILAWRHRHC